MTSAGWSGWSPHNPNAHRIKPEHMPSATVKRDSYMGEPAATVGDRSNVTRSVIGGGCKIGRNCKIMDSVVFSGATVGDGCSVDSTIIMTDAVIASNTTLRKCQVPRGMKVPEGKYVNEVLDEDNLEV
eukprot:Platyproteum_vivax@DN1728_c0_g1_i2.p1